MKKNRVQSAMDAHLSHLELTTYEKRALLDAATGVAHPHRKRPALLLLLVALVLLLASVAIALSLWNPAVEHAVQEEVRKGSYETWAVSEKLDFLHALAGYGLEMALPDVHGLSEEDADLILTQYIQNRFGDHTSSLAENIAGAEYGMFGLWSLEDKAGYTQLLHTHGLLNPGVPVYYVPEEGSLSKAQVMGIAHAAIQSTYAVDASTLAGLSAYYGYYADAAAPEERVWQVDLREGNRLRYSVKIAADGSVCPNGIVRQPSQEEVQAAIDEEQQKVEDAIALLREMEAAQGPMYQWSLEDQAKVFPESYGLPSEGEVPLERALAIARETAKEAYGWSEETLGAHTLYAHFHIGQFDERNYYTINFFLDGEPVASVELYADDGTLKTVAQPNTGNG